MNPSDLVISQTDGRPMYLQIVEQIRERVEVGDWPGGAELPSIRQLAVALRVSVITVKRAYYELEREGVIVTQQGKGSTVAVGIGRERPTTPLATVSSETPSDDEALARLLTDAVRIALRVGRTPAELAEQLEQIFRTSLRQEEETE